jgi:hypothetical protein
VQTIAADGEEAMIVVKEAAEQPGSVKLVQAT